MKIAAVGDSNTYDCACCPKNANGALSSTRWPVMLAEMLCDEYEVSTFAKNGMSVRAPWTGEPLIGPFVATEEGRAALASDADIFVVMLGTNDAMHDLFAYLAPIVARVAASSSSYTGHIPWDEAYLADFTSLLTRFKELPQAPRVIGVAPPPCWQSAHPAFGAINVNLTRLGKLAAQRSGVEWSSEAHDLLSDGGTALIGGNVHGFSCDGVHLDATAHRTYANAIARAIRGNSTAPLCLGGGGTGPDPGLVGGIVSGAVGLAVVALALLIYRLRKASVIRVGPSQPLKRNAKDRRESTQSYDLPSVPATPAESGVDF